jgi:hypothetical protein
MIDIETLTSQIKRNCDISDAKYWGAYSICTLLLKFRELFRSERGVKPWESINQKEIGMWISERETLWNELEGEEFINISINGNLYRPFEVKKINAELEKKGLIYGAGFGVYMKPSFFLADIISQKKWREHDIYIAGNEYVRDLSVYPAMLQDKIIFARIAPTRLLLWEKFDELRSGKPKKSIEFAFLKYGITPDEEPSEDIDKKIYHISHSEVETYIHHELGEAFEGEEIRDEWKSLISDTCSSRRAEFFTRSIKDILSDTSEKGMIRYIIETQKEGSLGFYLVFLTGYRKLLFPEIVEAFQKFTETSEWELVENARRTGYKKAKAYMDRLLSFYGKNGKIQLLDYIENNLLKELE